MTLRESGDKEIQLLSKALAEIADDSDHHRTRIGYAGYESATLLRIGDKEWAVALGIACGSCPADPYNCDVAAVQISSNGKSDDQVASEVFFNALRNNFYFGESLVYTMADGRLAVCRDGSFGQKVLELLRPRTGEFIMKDLEIDTEHFYLDLRPVVKSAVRYKPETTTFLADVCRTVLVS